MENNGRGGKPDCCLRASGDGGEQGSVAALARVVSERMEEEDRATRQGSIQLRVDCSFGRIALHGPHLGCAPGQLKIM